MESRQLMCKLCLLSHTPFQAIRFRDSHQVTLVFEENHHKIIQRDLTTVAKEPSLFQLVFDLHKSPLVSHSLHSGQLAAQSWRSGLTGKRASDALYSVFRWPMGGTPLMFVFHKHLRKVYSGRLYLKQSTFHFNIQL